MVFPLGMIFLPIASDLSDSCATLESFAALLQDFTDVLLESCPQKALEYYQLGAPLPLARRQRDKPMGLFFKCAWKPSA